SAQLIRVGNCRCRCTPVEESIAIVDRDDGVDCSRLLSRRGGARARSVGGGAARLGTVVRGTGRGVLFEPAAGYGPGANFGGRPALVAAHRAPDLVILRGVRHGGRQLATAG